MERIEIGKTQQLKVLRNSDFGVYLGLTSPSFDPDRAVLLPKKQVPEGTRVGDLMKVFVYKDSEDRPIATVKSPMAEVGGFAYLAVKSVTKIGAFLDWGLEKDLFLPFKEQEKAFRVGDHILVYVYLDKSDRLSATSRIYDHLSPSTNGLFHEKDSFTGFVYRVEKSFGVFVAVEKEGQYYFGLIPAPQVFRQYEIGERVNGRIVRVRKDGKLDLSCRARDFEQLEADGNTIIEKINAYGGVLPFSENASPEMIKRELEMSKSGFKKALGHLLKQGRINIGETEITLLK